MAEKYVGYEGAYRYVSLSESNDYDYGIAPGGKAELDELIKKYNLQGALETRYYGGAAGGKNERYLGVFSKDSAAEELSLEIFQDDLGEVVLDDKGPYWDFVMDVFDYMEKVVGAPVIFEDDDE